MPDRLRAGLQFLVLTMLVRIQLGQRTNPPLIPGGFLFLDILAVSKCGIRDQVQKLDQSENVVIGTYRECYGVSIQGKCVVHI